MLFIFFCWIHLYLLIYFAIDSCVFFFRCVWTAWFSVIMCELRVFLFIACEIHTSHARKWWTNGAATWWSDDLLIYVALRSFDSSEWIVIWFENILFVFLVNECACGIIFFTIDSCVNLFCCARDSYECDGYIEWLEVGDDLFVCSSKCRYR